MVEYRFGNLSARLISKPEKDECPHLLSKETRLPAHSSKWVDGDEVTKRSLAPEARGLRRSVT